VRRGRGISLRTANLVMVIFLRTVHFVLAAVDLVILTTMFLKVLVEGTFTHGTRPLVPVS